MMMSASKPPPMYISPSFRSLDGASDSPGAGGLKRTPPFRTARAGYLPAV